MKLEALDGEVNLRSGLDLKGFLQVILNIGQMPDFADTVIIYFVTDPPSPFPVVSFTHQLMFKPRNFLELWIFIRMPLQTPCDADLLQSVHILDPFAESLQVFNESTALLSPPLKLLDLGVSSEGPQMHRNATRWGRAVN